MAAFVLLKKKMSPQSDCFIISFTDNATWWITGFYSCPNIIFRWQGQGAGSMHNLFIAFRLFVCVIMGLETVVCVCVCVWTTDGCRHAGLGHTGSELFIFHFSRLHQLATDRSVKTLGLHQNTLWLLCFNLCFTQTSLSYCCNCQLDTFLTWPSPMAQIAFVIPYSTSNCQWECTELLP